MLLHGNNGPETSPEPKGRLIGRSAAPRLFVAAILLWQK
jgi:hypothetical protein